MTSIPFPDGDQLLLGCLPPGKNDVVGIWNGEIGRTRGLRTMRRKEILDAQKTVILQSYPEASPITSWTSLKRADLSRKWVPFLF